MSNAILSKFNKYHLIKATLIMLSFTVFFVGDAFADTNENCIVTMNTRCTFSDGGYLDITGVETNSTFVRYISKTGETIGQTQLNPFGGACMLPTRYGTRLLPSSHSFTSILDGKNTINIQADVEVYYYSFANLWTCQRQFSIPWSYQTSPVYTFTEKSSLSLLSSDPIDSATQVPIDSPITLDFSEGIDSTSIKDNISLTLNGNQIEYGFSQSDDKKGINIKLTSGRFAQNKIYALTIGKNLKDISGNTLGTDKVISFTTEVMPYSLSQQINSPQMEEEPHDVYLGEKIGKFQSGSGIILSAIVDNSFGKNLNLDFEVYKLGESLPIYKRSTEVNLGIGTVVVDFLGAGDYYWRVRTSDDSGNSSDWADFGMNLFGESDFSYFYGFEPYPYGYRFPNASVADGVLNGMGLSSIVRGIPPNSFLINQPTIIDGNKWNLFNNAFDTSTLKNDDRKMIDAFESLGLNTDEQFQGGNCYGMAMSPAMQFTHSGFIQTNYSKFSNQIGNGTIWDNIIPLDVDGKDDWNNYDGNKTLEIILSFQLSQSSVHIQKAIHNGTKSPDKILTELKNNSNNTYALLFWGKDKNNDDVGHAVIPYKVEGNRIYVWDNNFQYPFREINNTEIYSYNQYIELYTGSDGKIKWKDKTYEWNEFTEMSLVNLDDIYNNGYKSVPMGFNGNGTSYTLSGSSSIYISDSLGRVSGFTSSGVIEDIPGVDVIVPLNVTLSGATKSNLKQIYIPEKIDGLTIKVSGIKEENYDLKIAGGDYYTNISGVNTLTGQIDIFTTTNSGIFIDFDDSKTGTYTLLTDNFQDTLTGTVFSPGIESIIQPQKYIFDWNKVMQGSTNAISYQIDIDNDGIYDLTSNFSPVPKSLDEKGSISGYVKGDTNASMAGWKVFIDKNDNGKLEEYSEIFTTTDNKGYYRFDNLEKGNYNIAEIPHQNWNLIKPTNYKYNLYLNNGQNVINLDFVNTFTKGKGK